MAQTITLIPSESLRFNELMESTYKKVYNMAYRLTGSRSDAEDLTQEAYYRAFRSFGDYEGDRPFENWIFRILSRLFLDLLRSRRRRVMTVSYDNPLTSSRGDDTVYFDVADSVATVEEQLVSDSISDDLQRALGSLNADQRLIVTLADIQGMPYHEISEMLEIPVGTVRSRLHRAHKALRARLEAGKPKSKPKVGLGRFAPSAG